MGDTQTIVCTWVMYGKLFRTNFLLLTTLLLASFNSVQARTKYPDSYIISYTGGRSELRWEISGAYCDTGKITVAWQEKRPIYKMVGKSKYLQLTSDGDWVISDDFQGNKVRAWLDTQNTYENPDEETLTWYNHHNSVVKYLKVTAGSDEKCDERNYVNKEPQGATKPLSNDKH